MKTPNPLSIKHNIKQVLLVILVASLAGSIEIISIASVFSVANNFGHNISQLDIFQLMDFGEQSIGYNLALVALLICIANLFRIFAAWLQLHVSWGIQARTSTLLLSHFISLPYSSRIQTSDGEITSEVFNETEYVCSGYIQPLIKFVSGCVILAISVLGLIYILNSTEIFTIFGIFLLFIILLLGVIKPLLRGGKKRIAATRTKHDLLANLVHGMEIVEQTNSHNFFIKNFYRQSLAFAKVVSLQGAIKSAPRSVIEMLLITGAVGYVIVSGETIASLIPLFGALLVFAYRMMPQVVTLISSASDIIFYRPAFKKLHARVSMTLDRYQHPAMSSGFKRSTLPHDTYIVIKDFIVDYDKQNPDSKVNVGSNRVAIDLNIPSKKIVALAGRSGSGKSTIGRVISKIQDIDSGLIELNSLYFPENTVVRYVGPEPVFFEFGLENNIGFSDFVSGKKVNKKRVETVLRLSGISKETVFQTRSLSSSTKFSEFSSGQRQRIAIARALYDDPDILILDETLSNLDQKNQDLVFENLRKTDMLELKLLIIITHDTRSLSNCDTILNPFDEVNETAL